MKPAPFTYHRPESGDEVDGLLAELAPEAKILAGGQSLVPILNMRLANPAHLIDINRLNHRSSQIASSGDTLAFGPLVRQQTAESASVVAEQAPLLAEALRYVAHPAIRSRGTVVGSIAHADPAAELPAVLVVLKGEVIARSSSEKRVIPAAEFFAGPLENSLSPLEWVAEVRFPRRDPLAGYAFEEFARRHGDYALCGVAAMVRKVEDGRFQIALAYLGVGEAPVRLTTGALGPKDFEEAVGELVSDELDPPGDIHASREFRAHLARRLGARASLRALGTNPEDA